MSQLPPIPCLDQRCGGQALHLPAQAGWRCQRCRRLWREEELAALGVVPAPQQSEEDDLELDDSMVLEEDLEDLLEEVTGPVAFDTDIEPPPPPSSPSGAFDALAFGAAPSPDPVLMEELELEAELDEGTDPTG